MCKRIWKIHISFSLPSRILPTYANKAWRNATVKKFEAWNRSPFYLDSVATLVHRVLRLDSDFWHPSSRLIDHSSICDNTEALPKAISPPRPRFGMHGIRGISWEYHSATNLKSTKSNEIAALATSRPQKDYLRYSKTGTNNIEEFKGKLKY